jgi:hypothetical protein
MRRALGLFSVWLLLVSSGCGDDGGGGNTTIPEACNPLGGGACLLPWPSAAYLEDDTSTRTGFRVDIPIEATPVNLDGDPYDPAALNEHDGFSPNATIVVAFPTGVSDTGLPAPDDIAAWTSASAPVAIIDMADHSRPAFFAEVDLNHEDPTRRALLIRPAVRLQPEHRYAVVVTKSVKAPDGSDLPIPEGFQALLDGRTLDHPRWAKVAARHPEVMTALQAAGIAEANVVIAWDFVTASDVMLTRDLRAMRDRALAMIEPDASNLTFDAEIEAGVGDPSQVLRFIVGTYDAPSFLSDGEADDSILVRDADGLPTAAGMFRWNFGALVPKCVETTPGPKPVVIFGHGLFGTGAGSLDSGLLMRVANDNCAIFIAGDFIGLTERNVTTAIYAVYDINDGKAMIEKLPQSVINFMALTRLAKGPLRTSALFEVGGQSSIDPARVYYYGASLGGIMGHVYMAYEPDISIGILGVPGANWSMLFERSLAWPPLRTTMQNSYTEPFIYATNLALMGTFWDRYDPITTAPYSTVGSTELGIVAKKLFAYSAVADSLVNRHSTEMMIRTMQIPITTPSIYVPFGMVGEAGPMASGFTIYDEHPTPVPPSGNVAPVEDNGTHGGVHERGAVQRQVTRMINEGMLFHECKLSTSPMPCDCGTEAAPTGACD